jgi:hypothetical protein
MFQRRFSSNAIMVSLKARSEYGCFYLFIWWGKHSYSCLSLSSFCLPLAQRVLAPSPNSLTQNHTPVIHNLPPRILNKSIPPPCIKPEQIRSPFRRIQRQLHNPFLQSPPLDPLHQLGPNPSTLPRRLDRELPKTRHLSPIIPRRSARLGCIQQHDRPNDAPLRLSHPAFSLCYSLQCLRIILMRSQKPHPPLRQPAIRTMQQGGQIGNGIVRMQ